MIELYTVKSQTGCKLVRNRVNLRQFKNQTDKCTEVRQPVLADKSYKASLIEVPIKRIIQFLE